MFQKTHAISVPNNLRTLDKFCKTKQNKNTEDLSVHNGSSALYQDVYHKSVDFLKHKLKFGICPWFLQSPNCYV